MMKELAHSINLTSTGDKLFSYNTCIAQWKGDTLLINITKYSATTTKHLYYVKRYGIPYITVDNVKLNTQDLWKIM